MARLKTSNANSNPKPADKSAAKSVAKSAAARRASVPRRTPTSKPVRERSGPRLEKLHWGPGSLLSPVPAVLIACCRPDGSGANLITVAWAGTVCSEPNLLAISVRPERHSHDLIRDTGEFVVNLPDVAHAEGLDRCGVISGRDTDKWAAAGFSPEAAATVRPPLVAECPLALECRVRSSQALGSHTLFIGEVTAVRVDPRLVDAKGRLALEAANLVAYCHGEYFSLGRKLGYFGWSVRKKKNARRR